MSNIKALIFDLDGVLVDTAIYHYKAWKRLANHLGFDFTEEENEKLKGVSRVRSLELILEWGGVSKSAEEQKKLTDLKNSWYVEMIQEMHPSEILPGAKEFLEVARAAGLKTALGSASKNSETILQKVGLTHLFDVIIDGNKVTASKPDPEVFLKGAEALGIAPENCLVFEDALAGVQAALGGGMKVIGFGTAQNLPGANLVVAGLHEVSIELVQTV
jgi:beta-phosphoglucomutase